MIRRALALLLLATLSVPMAAARDRPSRTARRASCCAPGACACPMEHHAQGPRARGECSLSARCDHGAPSTPAGIDAAQALPAILSGGVTCAPPRLERGARTVPPARLPDQALPPPSPPPWLLALRSVV